MQHAIIELVDKLLFQFEKNRYMLVIFVDVSKAFDTGNHQILFKKFNLFSITGNKYSWIENYLTNQKQRVEINNNENTFQDIICGEPQRSFLGPFLKKFLMF